MASLPLLPDSAATALGQEDLLVFRAASDTVARRGQKAGDFGGRVWEGPDTPAACWSSHFNTISGDEWAGGDAHLWAGGKGRW